MGDSAEYKEGYNTFVEKGDDSLILNPHNPVTQQFADWAQGWLDAAGIAY